MHCAIPNHNSSHASPTTHNNRPPRNDAKGIAIACSLIAAWALLFYHGCWQVRLTDAPDGSSRRSSWADILATFFLLEFVNTVGASGVCRHVFLCSSRHLVVGCSISNMQCVRLTCRVLCYACCVLCPCTLFVLPCMPQGLFITTHDAMHGTICYRCAGVSLCLVVAVCA